MEFNEKYFNQIKARVIGVTTPSVDFIPDSEGIVSYAARVSSPQNQTNFDTAAGLLKYCMKHSHWSVFDMVNVVVEIEVPRDIARQVLRHSSMKFQEFCIAGDSVVKTDSGLVTIEDLYSAYVAGEALPNVKVYDEDTRQFKYAPIVEVFDTGGKPVYEIKLASGRKIKATSEHKFLTRDGFKRLAEISVGDEVGINGVPCYQHKEWLAAAKNQCIEDGRGLKGIATLAGVTTHTIRKWLRIHGLQFSKKEVAQYTQIWNKGLPSDQQPMFNKHHAEGTREKMRESSRKGEDSDLWAGGKGRCFRQTVWDWQHKYRNLILKRFGNQCVECCADDSLEIDHILPVKSHPDAAFDLDNLQVLCKECHQSKTASEFIESPNYSRVVSIVSCGPMQTYDLEVDHNSHNYVANGIVTHNSQRYAVAQEFMLREARLQDYKNRQNSIDVDDEELQAEWDRRQQEVIDLVTEHYSWAVSKDVGIAKECARVILPEGNTMSYMYANGTLRSWITWLMVRDDEGVTQKEHVYLARQVKPALVEHFSFLEELMNEEQQ